jgi:polyhydroxyalkanoate synthesis regulator phasin
MVENEGLRRYIDAGMALTQITRARADELVRDLIKTGEIERTRAQEWVEDLVRQSRERSEAFVHLVRNEVRAQLDELGVTNLDDLAKRVAEILARSSERARKAGQAATRRAPARRRTAKKTAAKRAPAKKTAAKKTAAKRAPAKKAPAKKTAAKKAPAKKTAAKKART